MKGTSLGDSHVRKHINSLEDPTFLLFIVGGNYNTVILFLQSDSYFLNTTDIPYYCSLWEGWEKWVNCLHFLFTALFEFLSLSLICLCSHLLLSPLPYFTFCFTRPLPSPLSYHWLYVASLFHNSLAHSLPPHTCSTSILLLLFFILNTNSLFHSLVASFTLSFTHSLIHSLITSVIPDLFTHFLTHCLTHNDSPPLLNRV